MWIKIIIEGELKIPGIEIDNESRIDKFDELIRFSLNIFFFDKCPKNTYLKETSKNQIELAKPFETIEKNLANFFTDSVEKRYEECNSQEK
ncbi:unnamed protein product [Brachionus calyciflorus]|uniref:Uncharacterized protein n=1 Tax=Brachionus calyciflorus TaxID=104777 RepID=A0A814BLK4_9BILA|nr:unnamed protein product [Brachionus calyciflorus]